MVRSYLRYEQDASWGVVVSGSGDVAVDTSGRLAIAPALEAVAVWNLKTGALVYRLQPSSGSTATEVTALTLGADGDTLAVGHDDGAIRLWQLSEGTERLTFNGHKSAVSTLRLNRGSTMLISGAKDTAVIVWDVVAEAGLCRLRGHRDAISDVCFLEAHNALASVSKDGTLRVWDLHTQHCVQSVAAPSGELWSVDVDDACERLITGGAKAELIAWRLESTVLAKERPPAANGAAAAEPAEAGGEEWRGVRAIQLGPLAVKVSTSRVSRLRFGLDDNVIAVQFADRNLSLYSVQSAAQLKRQLKRRAAKRRKSEGGAVDGGDERELTMDDLAASDCYLPLSSLKGSHKLHSFAFLPRQKAAAAAIAADEDDDDDGGGGGRPKRDATARLLVSDRHNALQVHACELKQGGLTSVVSSVQLGGHRTEPRCLAMSTDERMLFSASDGEAKVWNAKSRQCVGTFECGYGLSCAFLLANKYALVGTKSGALQAFCLASAEMVCEVAAAHSGAVWSLALQPGGTSILSASADKTIAIWTPVEGGGNTLRLEETQRHELTDDVLCARYTHAGKYIAVALLDASIRVLFADSFELFLTLYGHKLPVLSLSASSDFSLLVSGSADKTIKIWGLDFGDCHRSLYGHTEAVMATSFVKDTHFFFSSAKDKTIRYWDADKFEQILVLRGHHAEVWSVVPARSGAMLASVSRDRSLRLWKRTDEQVFVDEERENELELVFNQELEQKQRDADGVDGDARDEEAALLRLEGAQQAEASAAGRRTMESVKGAERVLEALKVLEEEAERHKEYAQDLAKWKARTEGGLSTGADAPKMPVLVPNMLLLGMDEGAYLLKALSSVRASELEQALLLLPFDSASHLLTRLLPLVPAALPAELITRCVLFLLKVHHKRIVNSRALVGLVDELDASLKVRLAREHAAVGYNLAAMRFMKQSLQEKSEAKFFEAALEEQASRTTAPIHELRRKTAARQPAGKAKPRAAPGAGKRKQQSA